MSDNTPGSAEFEELPEDEVKADLADAAAADTSRDAQVDDDSAEELDLQLDEPVDAAAVAQSGVRRKTAKAPVRRKDLSSADDDVIAELETGLPADERGTHRNAKAPVKKDRATKKRSDSTHVEADPYATANPAVFVKQSASELKKVVWPTWAQLVAYFLSVLVFVLFFIAFVGLLDMFFGWGLLKLFGDSR